MVYNISKYSNCKETDMKLLEQRIKDEAVILPGGVIKVTGFLNHRLDIPLLDKIGKEFHRIFSGTNPDIILTAEASGIGIACLTARYFGCNIIYAKKSKSRNMTGDIITSTVRSFTRGTVFEYNLDARFLTAGMRVLIIDDFIADGEALGGLIDVAKKAGAEIVGAGVCVEKAFQPGGDKIRKSGINFHSLARVDTDEQGNLIFMPTD